VRGLQRLLGISHGFSRPIREVRSLPCSEERPRSGWIIFGQELKRSLGECFALIALAAAESYFGLSKIECGRRSVLVPAIVDHLLQRMETTFVHQGTQDRQ
jgi:hypothetical protein